jgi:hypothetical protein
MRKQIAGLLGAASIATVALIADAPAGIATPSAPASSAGQVSVAASKVGGKISRKEVISRAKFWIGKGIVYNQKTWPKDPKGRRYRPDCSGYVSMALHLGSSQSTVGLGSKTYGVKLKSRKDMKMGDYTGILGAGTSGAAGHVRIFEKWKSKTAGTYWAYDFGSTPVKHKVYKLSTDKPRNHHGWTAYRYKKIT